MTEHEGFHQAHWPFIARDNAASPLSEPAGTANTAERLQALREATRELVAAALRVLKVIDRSTVAVESLKDAIALALAELNREAE